MSISYVSHRSGETRDEMNFPNRAYKVSVGIKTQPAQPCLDQCATRHQAEPFSFPQPSKAYKDVSPPPPDLAFNL